MKFKNSWLKNLHINKKNITSILLEYVWDFVELDSMQDHDHARRMSEFICIMYEF